MSSDSPAQQSEAGTEPKQPTQEELRAALEAEFRQVRVEDLIKQSTASLLNVGAFKAGLISESEQDRDPAQVETAVEAASLLLDLLERRGATEDIKPLRDALAQLQLAYAQQSAGTPTTNQEPSEQRPPTKEGEDSGSAQSSGRLWVPGS